MVLRNVPKTDSFEQQRVEINEIAADLHALDTNVGALTLDDLTGVNAANPQQDQILKFNGTNWVLDTDILSTNFSVTTAAASGSGALAYNQPTGVFTYTPPDLSGFLTTVSGLPDLADVNITNIQTNQILKFDGTNWVNDVIASTQVNDINDIGNVTITNVQNNQVLKYNGTAWVNAVDSTGTTISGINDIGDVTITSAQNDQLLKWDGNNWINFTPGYLTSFTEQDPTVPAHVKGITQANINAWNAKSDVSALNDLSDVSTTGAANGKILKYNGTSWEIADDSGTQSDWAATTGDAVILNKPTIPTALNDLTDVNTTGAANNKILKHNGTSWVVADDVSGSSTANTTTSDTAPGTPTDGDLWWKSDEGRLKVYYTDANSSQWVDANPPLQGSGGSGGATVTTHDNAPSNPSDGDLWFKTDEAQLKIYYDDGSGSPSAQWVDAGGGGTGIALSDLSVGAEGTASGDGSIGYNDTTGVFTYTPPVIPAAQIQSDWNQATTSALDFIKNKPTISNTTYSQSSVASAANVNLRLTGSDSTNDDILVTAGNNVTFSSVTSSGFTINSTGGGGSGNQGNDSVAVGSICIWSGTVANIPTGWALCDGQNNTVDLRDKFIIGARQDDSGVAKTNVTGSLTQTGGSKDAIVVEHTHTATVTDPGHTHTLTAQENIGDYTDNGSGPDQRSAAATITSNSNTTGITVANSDTGTSGTNANLPPYYSLCYIQKTTAGGASFSLSVATGTASGGGALSYNNTTGVFSFIPAEQTTITGNADNRIITGSATAGTLNAESNLTFDGTKLNLGDDKKITFGNNLRMEIYTDGSDNYIQLPADGGGAFPLTIKSNAIDALKINSTGATQLASLNVIGNVSLGAGVTDNITFQGKVNSDLDPMTNNAYDLGQVGNVWKEVFATTVTATTTNTSGNTSIGGTLSVTSNLTVSGGTNQLGNTTFVGSGGSGGVALKAEYNSNSIFEVSNLGNVGITGVLTTTGGGGGVAIDIKNGGDLVLNDTGSGKITLYCDNNDELIVDGIVYSKNGASSGFKTEGGTSSGFLKADGSVDTVTYTNKVVNFASANSTTEVNVSTANTWTDTGLTLTYTPLSSSSIILLDAYCNLFGKSPSDSAVTARGEGRIRIVEGSNVVGEQQYLTWGLAHSSTYQHYVTEKVWQFSQHAEYTNGNTNQKTFKVQLYRINGELKINRDDGLSYFNIMEITN